MRLCQTCGGEYSPTGRRQKYCPQCSHSLRKRNQPRICVICGQEYLPMGPTQKYCATCSPIVKRQKQAISGKAWAQENPDKMLAYGTTIKARLTNDKWHVAHPESMALARRKIKAKRRVLGFNPLNSPFPNCEGHHINDRDVIYIPEDMHKSVRHNIWTGRNMEKINALAGAFLTEDWT